MRRQDDRRAFSLIEVLVCLGILGVLLLPIMEMLITSNRAAASARRMLDTTLYAQSLLETMAELSPDDLPPGDLDLLSAAVGSLKGRGKGKLWAQVTPDLERPPPFPLEKQRIAIKRLPSGNVEISVIVEWQGVPGDEKTRQTIVLRELSVARAVK